MGAVTNVWLMVAQDVHRLVLVVLLRWGRAVSQRESGRSASLTAMMTSGSRAHNVPLSPHSEGTLVPGGQFPLVPCRYCPGNVKRTSRHCCVTFRTPIHRVVVGIADLWRAAVTVCVLSVTMLCHSRSLCVLRCHCLPYSCPRTHLHTHNLSHVSTHTMTNIFQTFSL